MQERMSLILESLSHSLATFPAPPQQCVRGHAAGRRQLNNPTSHHRRRGPLKPHQETVPLSAIVRQRHRPHALAQTDKGPRKITSHEIPGVQLFQLQSCPTKLLPLSWTSTSGPLSARATRCWSCPPPTTGASTELRWILSRSGTMVLGKDTQC